MQSGNIYDIPNNVFYIKQRCPARYFLCFDLNTSPSQDRALLVQKLLAHIPQMRQIERKRQRARRRVGVEPIINSSIFKTIDHHHHHHPSPYHHHTNLYQRHHHPHHQPHQHHHHPSPYHHHPKQYHPPKPPRHDDDKT